MGRRRWLALACAACCMRGLTPATPAAAQIDPRDSARYRHEARTAQGAFERYRREHAPRTQPGATPPCEAQVGRLCYWHGDGRDPVVGEPAGVSAARHKLVRTLDRLSALSRADGWIVGERVRYLAEGGYDSAAVVASRECWAAAWWCAALNGFALHAAARYEESEAAFDTALARMPPDERCRWTDISLLLPGDDERRAYQRLPCNGRGEIERRFWQLADPAYTIAGNDRRTEHFSRVVLAKLSEGAANAYGLSWGDDMRELLIRYGTPVSYASTWAAWPSMTPGFVGFERSPSFHFAALDAASDTAQWDLRAERARERYAPWYLDTLVDFDAQFGMFRRGDSAVVVAKYVGGGGGTAALGVLDSSRTTVSRDSLAGARVRMARVAWRATVAGVEQFDPATGVGRRARVWLAPPAVPPGAPALSTMLLFDGTDTSAVSSLDDAARRALTSDRLAGTRRLGVYWEAYGAPDDSAYAVSIAVSPAGGGGVLQRLVRALRGGGTESRLAVAWHEGAGAGSVSYRSVVLDLSELPAGTYRVALTVGPDNATRAATHREIRLVGSPPALVISEAASTTAPAAPASSPTSSTAHRPAPTVVPDTVTTLSRSPARSATPATP